MLTTRTLAASLAATAIVALTLTGCASGTAEATGTDGSVDAATATSISAFGDLAGLEAAAIEEGALNVIALPRDWANYGAVLDLFAEKYPEITITEAAPDGSSAEEIQAAENLAGQDTAPDVFDLGLAVALANTDQFAPYQVATWSDIPDALKEESGLYVGDYGGYMAVGYDPDAVPAPESLADLLGADYKGKVAINGDPTQAGAAFAAVGMAAVQNDGSVDDFQAGIDFFSDLNAAGNFVKVDPTPATIASGETPVVFDWDYLNVGYGAQLEGERNWEVVVFPGTGYAGYYNQAINVDAPHPAAARLWQEFLYSDEAQNLWLEGGARPARADAMAAEGTIDADLFDALPAVPDTTVVPTAAQSEAAATLLGEKWAAAVQ
ncbi:MULTISPECIES: ABC transporter substrate-binding protein [Cryobacterium]|uniref:ABC transporter substrate-binding protein n=1 Tax=Cryobacterium zongtaii TaxID=1259217 RepID=A0A2S3ZA36_9MICO|nr:MULTISPECIES: ABC transporter substrate-binding protein [Cryobacterium]ASD22654.1 ABC transporter substrate-binding protein [Cryobacterium sp. LW097]POH62407.1 ABC transporter substrate-binding protein [Cryobacterium zongtaii]POH66168.1 ABC transporter substrate-binding protein [Cryobacterium zongtaii]TFC46841.1 ABC transporter substrate-binding protein [Cryobacterium sp. TMN-39-2]TFC50989.1 ABC transporter substrate-binding protein [Cryobacterium sp. TMB3-1-2]